MGYVLICSVILIIRSPKFRIYVTKITMNTTKGTISFTSYIANEGLNLKVLGSTK